MANAGRIKRIDSGRSKARFQYAAIFGAIGLVLGFIGIKFNTKDYLTPASSQQRAEHGLTRPWLDNSDLPVGVTEQGHHLEVWKWGGSAREIDLGGTGAATPLWSMAPDLSRVAWIADGVLDARQRPLENPPGEQISVPLPQNHKALAVTELSDGSLAVIFDDSTAGRWSADGHLLGQDKLPFDALEQATALQDYVALGSSRSGNMFLYQYRPGEQWKVVDRSPAPDLPFRLVILAPGMMGALSQAGLHRGGRTQDTPGAVQSAASHLDDFLITGDFGKPLVLPLDGEPYPHADAQPGALVAASHNRVSLSGPTGTRLIQLGMETRLTATGRRLASIGAILLGAAPLLIVKLLDLLTMMIRGGKKQDGGKHVPKTLDQPPPQMVDRFTAGEGVIWAGAGLSAQSGLPARQAFATSLLQTALLEKWAPTAVLHKADGLVLKGQVETALDEIVAASAHRKDLFSYVRAVYSKYAARSRSHEMISHLPLAGVITTNYDGLLDCGEDAWCSRVLTLASPLPAQFDGPFLLKLYGDMPLPLSVQLSRVEMGLVFPKSEAARIPRTALAERTVLFVGCSLEGLAADLNIVGAPAKLTQEHYAAVGISHRDWSKQAEALKEQFGVQVIPCSADTIAQELPKFLETLAVQVRKSQGAESAKVPADAV